MKTAFISGHLDLTIDEFNFHYKPMIDSAIENGDSFVVGDANGADKMSIYYLFIEEKVDVTIYHMLEYPRNNVGFKRKGGYKSDIERDSAMTRDSDYDIAWVRAGRENSGTSRNIKRRSSYLASCEKSS
jgi:hypothetical protein